MSLIEEFYFTCVYLIATLCVFDSLGVGIFANDNPVTNNTALLASDSNQIGTIYCTSGLRNSSAGIWYSPNGTVITPDSGGTFTLAYGRGNFPSYAALQLNSGETLTRENEGVYTCVIPDEKAEEKVLHVGLYHSDFIGELFSYCEYIRK